MVLRWLYYKHTLNNQLKTHMLLELPRTKANLIFIVNYHIKISNCSEKASDNTNY